MNLGQIKKPIISSDVYDGGSNIDDIAFNDNDKSISQPPNLDDPDYREFEKNIENLAQNLNGNADNMSPSLRGFNFWIYSCCYFRCMANYYRCRIFTPWNFCVWRLWRCLKCIKKYSNNCMSKCF